MANQHSRKESFDNKNFSLYRESRRSLLEGEMSSLKILNKFVSDTLGAELEVRDFRNCPLQWPGNYGVHIQAPRRSRKNGKITVWLGKCKKHGHEQTLSVRDASEGGILIGIENPHRGGVSNHAYIFGVDGMQPHRPYIARVAPDHATVRKALEHLKPNPVWEAEEKGLLTIRQGDWWFIPRSMPEPKGTMLRNCRLWWPVFRGPFNYIHDEQGQLIRKENRERPRTSWTNHWADMICVTPSDFMFVRGKIRAPDHESLSLATWHRAVHNRVIAGTTPRQSDGLD